MLERHDARGVDECVGAVDAQAEAAPLQRPDELAGGHAALDGDIDARRQAMMSARPGGLGAEELGTPMALSATARLARSSAGPAGDGT